VCFVFICYQVENIPVTEQNRKCLSNNKNTPLMTNSSVDDYVAQMSLSGQWGDGIMLACASKKYERQINVLLEDSSLITFKPHEEESDDAEQQHQPLLCGFIRTAGSASPNHYVFLQRKKVEGNVCSTTPLVSSDVKVSNLDFSVSALHWKRVLLCLALALH